MKILMVLDSYFDYFRLKNNYLLASDLFYFEKDITEILFLLYRTDIKLILVDCAVVDPPLNRIFSLIQEYDKSILIIPYNLPVPYFSVSKYKMYCNFINLYALEMLPKDSVGIALYNKCMEYFTSEYEVESENISKRVFDAFASEPDKCICLSELCEYIFGTVTEKHLNTTYGYIHKLRCTLGDDKRKPKIIVKVEKGKYKLNLPSDTDIKLS